MKSLLLFETVQFIGADIDGTLNDNNNSNNVDNDNNNTTKEEITFECPSY